MATDIKITMQPIGPLMIEHRLIERVIALLEKKPINKKIVEAALDFLIIYADRCHHGKEEGFFFKELDTKPLSSVDKMMLESLKNDHEQVRGLVAKIADKTNAEDIEALTRLYRLHIRKEDKQFFIPAMKYFSKQEQDSMLCTFWEFDRKLIHEKYKSIVAKLEKGNP
ncbi:MAG: hemerythrin domain-containing protein [Candidatus Omnitrophica bacterium]|nr:hemerythrin domain-containing protein [Candidatus Omnitrophota bacterium]MDD5652947.1 hemerythrin domain-containing protein [Candidatus Omnitrophota bacterium]